MKAIVRFATVAHPHLTGDPFWNPAALQAARDKWHDTLLGRNLAYIGSSKRFETLDSVSQVEDLIRKVFPGTLHLASEGQWRRDVAGVRWTVALRKAALVAFVETGPDVDARACAHSLAEDHARVMNSVPGATGMGFASCVELVVPDAVPETDFGRLAPFAIADFLDPLQAQGKAEAKILESLNQASPAKAQTKTVGNRILVNWASTDIDALSACHNRLAWLGSIVAS